MKIDSRWHVEKKPAEQMLSWVENRMPDSDRRQAIVAPEALKNVINWTAQKIAQTNEETEFLPRLTDLYERLSREIGEGANYFRNEFESTGTIPLDPMLKKGKSDVVISSVLGMRHKSFRVNDNREERLETITDLMLFGLASGAEGHAPWGLDFSEQQIREILEKSRKGGQFALGMNWDAMDLHERAKKEMGDTATAGIMTRQWGWSVDEKRPVEFRGGVSLDGKKLLAEQVRKNRAKVFKLIVEPVLKNPDRESGYQKIHRVTGGKY